MIRCRSLRKEFTDRAGTVVALDDVDLDVDRGTVTGVVGPSGSGKSTLVRCLTALERPTSGTVEVDGQDLARLGDTALRQARRRTGMVFQHANLLANRTALGNVALPLEVVGATREHRLERARELLGLVGLGGREDAYPAQLSGGQRQRVGIARALAAEPAVLLCDEPTSALDPGTTREVLGVLGDVRARLGVTVVVVTHEMSVLREACDAVVSLADGRVVEQGPLADVVSRPGSALARDLVPLPPARAGDGALVDLVATGTDGVALLGRLARDLGTDLPVVAGGVERVGEVHLQRLRVRPGAVAPAAVVAAAEALGADGQVVLPGASTGPAAPADALVGVPA